MSPARRADAWIAAAVGLIAGIALAAAGGTGGERAAGQGPGAAPVQLTAQQLRINQRISRAAVRRSNEGLSLLGPVRAGPGWGAAQLSDGAVTAPKLADGAVAGAKLAPELRESLTRFAVVDAAGALVRARGALGAERTGFGLYRVTFDRGVDACALSATIAVAQPGGAVLIDRLPTLGIDPANPAVVTVRIQVVSMPANSEDAPFHLTAAC